MIKTNFKLNVDTLVVSEEITMNVGDTLKVVCDFAEAQGDGFMNVSWSLGQAPKNQTPGSTCIDRIGENPKEGSMTFKAVDEGWAYVKYEIVTGEGTGKSKKIDILIVA